MKYLKSLILSFTILAASGLTYAEVINAHPGVGTVIAFGDSLTSGFNNQIPYPKYLEERLHQPIVLNAVPGMSTADAVAKLPTLALDPAPKAVVFTIGGNDFFELPSSESR
jgi:lysophospholipase L1-like esterase